MVRTAALLSPFSICQRSLYVHITYTMLDTVWEAYYEALMREGIDPLIHPHERGEQLVRFELG